MEEIWKDIIEEGFEGLYQGSNFGRIRSLDRLVDGKNGSKRFVKGRILKTCLDSHGYPLVCLHNNVMQKTKNVHKLIWEAFNGKVPKGYEINHISECKTENSLSNLNLLTHKANLNWGTHNKRGAITKSIVLRNYKTLSKPVIQKSLEGEIIKIWPSTMEIQRQLGYDHGHIGACCRGVEHHNTAYGYIWEYYTEKAAS